MSLDVRAPSLQRELLELTPWLAAVAILWTTGVLLQRARTLRPEDTFAAWQRSWLQLPTSGQRLYRQLREGILEAENVRAATGAWPEPAALAADGVPPFAADALGSALTWTKRQHGVYVNYLGVPSGAGPRWLVLFIESEPGLLRGPGEQPPPVDEEHHTLPNGLALHVTVWTSQTTPGDEVLAFPVAEGWTQQLGR